MIQLGMHTDNWRERSGNFQTAIASAVKHGLSYVEFGVIHGQYFIHALGYDPSVSLQSNPRALKRCLDENGLAVSQIDAAYPLMGPDGSSFGVPYVQQAIRFAAEIGCPCVDTTDGASKVEGYPDEVVFRIACANYRQCLAWAKDYGVTINVETHGPYTNDGDFLERLFNELDSPNLGFNFDTGNTFIAGNDPLEYLKRFRQRLSHVHIKDVSEGLADTARGEETGIACSQVPIGGGVNAKNIEKCIEYLRETNWDGVLSIECHGSDENIEKSIQFLRGLLSATTEQKDSHPIEA
ncbi:MAG: sugar phosphate isomerase/epimerase family protein [Pirellulaceae bacterium]|jgi:sugar phosphate isomerase/epimerase|nr:sugar phosphate isomerase/epimerase family protein [Pirellulaceae bacterium]HJN66004.1 sugar phosphate isomerase/epimerase family protein [Pirellulales bacterium]